MQVFRLIESIELVCRCHLNVKNVRVLTSDVNIRKLIMDDVLQSQPVLECWEVISQCIDAKYESYSMELLQHIIDLWIKIRGHSFAKDFTDKMAGKYKKGTSHFNNNKRRNRKQLLL